jgi:predicted nucleic acid-binding protein
VRLVDTSIWIEWLIDLSYGPVAHWFFKAEFNRGGVSCSELTRGVECERRKETETSIANKLSRRAFSATFFQLLWQRSDAISCG